MNQSPYFAGKKKKSLAMAKKKQINSNNDGSDDDDNNNNNNNNNSDEEKVDSCTSTENNKMRDDLLLKLRPFQREAYEFATQGKITPRQCNDGKPDDLQYDSALLGKGRILLAGE
jgi:hypothetical protein